MKLRLDTLIIKSAFLLLVFSMISTAAMAQRTISGTVTDADNGDPLIGATVVVKGASVGTITDFDGKYSIEVSGEGIMLEYSYTGYSSQTMTVGADNTMDVAMTAGTILDEVVVVGYGSQSQKEITSAVVSVGEEEFNRGPISDPAQLLQGKVAGLQVYNRGGDPNRQSTIRMRGISTIGANSEPLVVIDGIIGASLQNVDPNDIASIDVLKDGSAAAIYGSRGSSGVIIVTTKNGKKSGAFGLSYNGQLGGNAAVRSVSVLDGPAFVQAGGTDLGSNTDWLEEVTQTGVNHVHNLAASGSAGNTSYRISGNYRAVDGILKNSGFDQFNTRLNISTTAFNDRLKIGFNSSLTNKRQQFSFNEALRYAVTYNPTAPVNGADSPFQFNSEQFGGFFESLGLFDSFNPVSIIEQNRNDGKRREFNYGANFGYNIFGGLTANVRIAQQATSIDNKTYYPTTSLFRGNATSPTRKGRADLYSEETDFELYEAYLTNVSDFGKSALTVTAGYSYQQNNFQNSRLTLRDFPNNDLEFINAIEVSQDLLNAGLVEARTDVSPDEKIIAMFARANYTFDNAIFVNASVRREGSTKLGTDNKWGIFPAFGVGVDLNNYLSLGGVDALKLRVGYGVTGALPRDNGLSQEIRRVENGDDGSVTTTLERAANPELKWEEKAETNIGIDFAAGRLSASLDLYNRDIKDFINEVALDASLGEGEFQFQNAGNLNTKGAELALNYDVVQSSTVNYTTGIVLSTYKTVLNEFVTDAAMRGNLGSPGQNETEMIRVKVGNEIGEIWGPVFTGVEEGSPVFEDLNNDGTLTTDQSQALEDDVDFQVLGNGLPDLELGWTNTLSIGDWHINAFFRGAFGHSLINTFRAFYEPRLSSQSSYNYVTTELAPEGLTEARFSSLYVEKADFFKLDNLTISRSFPLKDVKGISNLNISVTGQNLFVITSYTGADPEPSLVDYGAFSNGDTQDNPDDAVSLVKPDVLAPGIDRRNNYFSARGVTLGVSFDF